MEKFGEDWLHPLDLFYYGISRYEQKDYEGAVGLFDKALALYPDFSDVQYYKGVSLLKLGQFEEGRLLLETSKENAEKGNTINEDNVVYVRYPYQVRW